MQAAPHATRPTLLGPALAAASLLLTAASQAAIPLPAASPLPPATVRTAGGAAPGGGAPAAAREAALGWFEKGEAELVALSRDVWDLSETALAERRSAARVAAALQSDGFRVTRGVAGLPTAFVAEWGEGAPIVGILAEYDALPGLSQERGTVKTPRVAGGAGHGCGHNLLGAAACGAAMAARAAMERAGLAGTVRLYGCPAEETGVGKAFMAREGLFDDLDAAVAWHPHTRTEVSVDPYIAVMNFKVTFHGRAAHGAFDPWNGRSALDAVELMDHAANMMREHIPPTARIHYVIEDGGRAPNIVPDEATVWYFVRDRAYDAMLRHFAWLRKCAEAAALATETTHELRIVSGSHDILFNRAGSEAMERNLLAVGAPPFDEEDQSFARAIQRACGIEERGCDTTLGTLRPPDPAAKRGSTDAAEVSWITPLVHLEVATAPQGVPWHSWAVVTSARSPIGEKGMLVAARTLALTALDIVADGELRARMREEFRDATRGRPYVSPLPEGATPELPSGAPADS